MAFWLTLWGLLGVWVFGWRGGGFWRLLGVCSAVGWLLCWLLIALVFGWWGGGFGLGFWWLLTVW